VQTTLFEVTNLWYNFNDHIVKLQNDETPQVANFTFHCRNAVLIISLQECCLTKLTSHFTAGMLFDKTYRNKLTHLKEISKQNYYKQAFQKCHHDMKKTWTLFNEIIAIKNKSQQKN